MSKDVFSVYSEERGRGSATCIVSLQPDTCGRYSYQVIHTTAGTFGSENSLHQAMKRAKETAEDQFKYRDLHWKIKRIEEELAAIKRLTSTPSTA